jgi:hypothetical protein
VISGLQVYFDKSLGANLLYRFERPQYAEIRKRYITGPKVIIGQEKEMSAIYGAEHLLRMLGMFSRPSCAACVATDLRVSEPPTDGNYVLNGPRICELVERLCERTTLVRPILGGLHLSPTLMSLQVDGAGTRQAICS